MELTLDSDISMNSPGTYLLKFFKSFLTRLFSLSSLFLPRPFTTDLLLSSFFGRCITRKRGKYRRKIVFTQPGIM